MNTNLFLLVIYADLLELTKNLEHANLELSNLELANLEQQIYKSASVLSTITNHARVFLPAEMIE